MTAEVAAALGRATSSLSVAFLQALTARAGRYATYLPASALRHLQLDAPRKQFTPENIQVAEILNTPRYPSGSIATCFVAPGVTTALHRLAVREKQYVVSGRGRAEVGGRVIEVGPGDILSIPRFTTQRMTNLGRDELVFDCVCRPRFDPTRYEHLQDSFSVKDHHSVVASFVRFGAARSDAHHGQVALVTGGNRGIGLETCRALAAQGYTVLLAARDQSRGAIAARKLRLEGFDVRACKLDVTSAVDIAQTARLIASDFGRLDVLVNNAGVNLEGPEQRELDPSTLSASLAVNSDGPLALTQALRALLAQTKDSRVINVSSELASSAASEGLFPAYSASKKQLNEWSASLAPELAAEGISIACVSPGWVKTRMGGSQAPDTVEDAVQPIVWLATTPAPPTGGFFRGARAPDERDRVNIERLDF